MARIPTKKDVEPRPLPEPRPRGTKEQHMADAPSRGVAQGAASLVQEPCGSSWSFSGKQFLDATRRSDCQPVSSVEPPAASHSVSIRILRTWGTTEAKNLNQQIYPSAVRYSIAAAAIWSSTVAGRLKRTGIYCREPGRRGWRDDWLYSRKGSRVSPIGK